MRVHITTRPLLLCLAVVAAWSVAGRIHAQDIQLHDVSKLLNSPEQPCAETRPVTSCCDTSDCTSTGCGGSSCCGGALGDPWDFGNTLFGDDATNNGWDIGGWMQFGYHNLSDGIFNTYPNHLQAQQLYGYIEKVADGSEGLDFGGRMDLLYGTDAQNTQAFGNPPGTWDFQNGWDNGVYGWAMPQLYGEVAYQDLNVKVGHFYTLLGYQVVPATGNFFYSIPFTFNFSEAFTHTGVLGTYTPNDRVTLYGGWTLGWDTGFSQLNQGNSFLGGASTSVTDSITATYICTAGNLGWLGKGYTHSIVVDNVINDRWEYVFQSDLDHTNLDPFGFGNSYNTIGLNQYLYYTFTDKLRAGGRAEWWKANGISYYEITGGFNIMPTANLRIRPELRYQWSPAASAFDGIQAIQNPAGLPLQGAIFAIDAILTF